MAGTEAEHLTGALDRLRATFRWKADDLDATGLQARVGTSSLTLGGLLKHLALTGCCGIDRCVRGAGPVVPPAWRCRRAGVSRPGWPGRRG